MLKELAGVRPTHSVVGAYVFYVWWCKWIFYKGGVLKKIDRTIEHVALRLLSWSWKGFLLVTSVHSRFYLKMCQSFGKYFSEGGSIVDFSRTLPKGFFQGGKQWWNFILPTRNQENNFFCWKFDRKMSNLKIQGAMSPCPPFDAHVCALYAKCLCVFATMFNHCHVMSLGFVSIQEWLSRNVQVLSCNYVWFVRNKRFYTWYFVFKLHRINHFYN